MSRRTLALILAAMCLLTLATVLSTRWTADHAPVGPSPSASADAAAAAPSADEAAAPVKLRRPGRALVELGVLTHRDEGELREQTARGRIASLLGPKYCGPSAACDAVRSTLQDETATSLAIASAADWDLTRLDVDAAGGGLNPSERSLAMTAPWVVSVRVQAPATSEELALRTGLAVTAAIADAVGGLVHDPLLGRIERPVDFAAHAVTSPLGGETFREDRMELLYEPKSGDTARVLTAGLMRWGAPDVEAARVPDVARERVGRVVLAVARAIAEGASDSPIPVDPSELQGATHDAGPPVDASAHASVLVEVTSVPPEPGDPNDFVARVEPPEGDGPLGYLDLAEKFFGPLAVLAPEPQALARQHRDAQARLTQALERWKLAHDHGEKLLARLPFAIPGDAGFESMWLEISGFDDQHVAGKLLDEPLGATDVSAGDVVTRPRADVEALRWIGAVSHDAAIP